MGKSAPKAPDPMQTAQAQAGMNQSTATQQQLLNMVNQEGPWGSVNYSQTGNSTFTDPFTGKVTSVPQFTQTTNYNPEQQKIFDLTQESQANMAQLGADTSARMGEYLADPFQFTNDDASQWAYDLASPRILQQQGQNQRDLEQQLVNSGIRRGTAAWDREMGRMTNVNTDQMNQLALQGRGQAFNEAMATRAQPINEISALLSGSQIGAPNQGMSATPQAQVGGVDYSGLVQNNYQQQMGAYNNYIGGLFGSIGTAAGMAAKGSDRRIKENIVRVGTLDNGLPVYAYNYKSGGPTELGLMAQDVELVNPSAVTEIDGVKHVYYGKAVQ